ncbi:MAG: hypothetical protein ACLSAF_06795 [Intestinimonas sp.]
MQYEEKKLRAETAPHHVILEGRISVRIWEWRRWRASTRTALS